MTISENNTIGKESRAVNWRQVLLTTPVNDFLIVRGRWSCPPIKPSYLIKDIVRTLYRVRRYHNCGRNAHDYLLLQRRVDITLKITIIRLLSISVQKIIIRVFYLCVLKLKFCVYFFIIKCYEYKIDQ